MISFLLLDSKILKGRAYVLFCSFPLPLIECVAYGGAQTVLSNNTQEKLEVTEMWCSGEPTGYL